YNYTVTVPQNYHVDIVNEKCNVFYVSDEIYEMGVVEVETPNGNKVRAYDKERCICDIIRSKGRMDSEQVKKAIKQYTQSRDKDIVKLSKYSKKMGLSDKVMEIVGGAYYE
ncbi:MAG: abortive phage infection protein, partial [Bacilli bacterium]|nr:abortive phage infection protein [Bacilli bacterium]